MKIDDLQRIVRDGMTEFLPKDRIAIKEKEGLLLFNYTPAAHFAGEWSDLEIMCRGLILNKHTGEIVARPFDKFFNWMEGGRRGSGRIVTVTEKTDGSMGVLFRYPSGRLAIATRGSFDSDQARWATQYLHQHCRLEEIPDNLTFIFEIIYPENRIVVDYGDREALVLLAVRDRFTGEYEPFFPNVIEWADLCNFELPKSYSFDKVIQILEYTSGLGENHEGVVVEMSDGTRWKFKGDRYLELHRLICGLSYRKVMEAVMNETDQALIDALPDYYQRIAKEWRGAFKQALSRRYWQVFDTYLEAPKVSSRKEFALWAKTEHSDIAPYLFGILDDKQVVDMIYHRELKHMEAPENGQ